ncbi:MAG: hypothetical protein PVJ80_09570 [Gemmatimonadota bacterium]
MRGCGLIRVLGSVLLLCATLCATADAQETGIVSITEYRARHPDVESGARLLFETRRCSALFSLVAESRRDRGDEGTAEMYTDWRIGFEVRAAELVAREGSASRIQLQDVARANQDAIERIQDQLRARMRRAGGLATDPLLSSDFRTCRALVDELRL